jgi:hypothetical protein
MKIENRNIYYGIVLFYVVYCVKDIIATTLYIIASIAKFSTYHLVVLFALFYSTILALFYKIVFFNKKIIKPLFLFVIVCSHLIIRYISNVYISNTVYNNISNGINEMIIPFFNYLFIFFFSIIAYIKYYKLNKQLMAESQCQENNDVMS